MRFGGEFVLVGCEHLFDFAEDEIDLGQQGFSFHFKFSADFLFGDDFFISGFVGGFIFGFECGKIFGFGFHLFFFAGAQRNHVRHFKLILVHEALEGLVTAAGGNGSQHFLSKFIEGFEFEFWQFGAGSGFLRHALRSGFRFFLDCQKRNSKGVELLAGVVFCGRSNDATQLLPRTIDRCVLKLSHGVAN